MSSLSLSLPARIVTPESFFSPFSAHSGGRIPGPKHLRSLYTKLSSETSISLTICTVR